MEQPRLPSRYLLLSALVALLAGPSLAEGGTIEAGIRRQQTDSLGDSVDAPIGSADTLDQEVREIASTIRCPVCLNLSLAASPSELARDMRAEIRTKLQEGQTPAEIRQYFVDRYGEWVLMTPEPEGISLALWILPALAVVGGGFVVVRVVRRWSPSEEGEDLGEQGGSA